MDEQQAPDFYDLAIVNASESVVWDHDQYQADIVIVALGTNDFSEQAGEMPSYSEYVPPYVSFARKILADHPKSKIILTDGPLISGAAKLTLIAYLRDVKARLASERVQVVEGRRYSGDACDFHPTNEQHTQIANDLLPHVKSLLD